MMKTIKNTLFNSATYILSNNTTKKALLIDCGDIEPIVSFIEGNLLELEGVLITHSHFDHIYGLNELSRYYSQCKVYTSEHGAEGLKNSKLNISRYHDNISDFIYNGENIELLAEGQEIKLGGETVKVIETPGHDWSCLTFHIGNLLFTGDSYIPNTKPQYSFPKGDRTLFINSEKRILDYSQALNLAIKPGHII